MSEKIGIVAGIATFLVFSVLCAWHHITMMPHQPLPIDPAPSAAVTPPPVAPAAVPAPLPPIMQSQPVFIPPATVGVTPIVPPIPTAPVTKPTTKEPSLPQSDIRPLRGKIIEFYFGSDILTPKGRGALNALLPALRRDPNLRVEIAGHTDDLGAEDHNLALSQRRADTVRRYLINQGITEQHLNSRGYGSSLPIADNATSEGRQRNRRTEIVVHPSALGS